jgi:plastocyanin
MLARVIPTILLTLYSMTSVIITTEPNAIAQNTSTITGGSSSSTTMSPPPAASSSHKIFYLFSAEHEGVNETKLGVPPDTFSPDVLEVNEGDNVTIHFYNLDTTDRHTFTIGAPYNINEDLLPEKNATFTFKAGDQGIFRFYCTYHQPTMSGQLVVSPRPAVEKTTTVSK